MKRAGFTMIELVFVIVILGILASVAIPKLAATRSDAEIAADEQRLTKLITELGSYYTAHGKYDNNLSKMTNEELLDSTKNRFSGNINTTPAYFGDLTKHKTCFKVVVDDSNGTLTITPQSDGSAFCEAFLREHGSTQKIYKFGGSAIYNN